jgi:hypothetical protein
MLVEKVTETPSGTSVLVKDAFESEAFDECLGWATIKSSLPRLGCPNIIVGYGV